MPYEPFSTSSFTPSTTPPTPFSVASYTPSTTPPTAFGTDVIVLANIAALKAIPTVGLAVGTVRNVTSAEEGEVRTAWELKAGDGSEEEDLDADPAIALPDDYDADDNQQYWERTL